MYNYSINTYHLISSQFLENMGMHVHDYIFFVQACTVYVVLIQYV